nr:lipase b [Quercus suber]
MRSSRSALLLATSALWSGSTAHSAIESTERQVIDRADVVGGLLADLNNISPGESPSSVIGKLQSVTPTATPTSAIQGLSICQSIYQTSPTPHNIWAASGSLVANGLVSENVTGLVQYLSGVLDGKDNTTNHNTRNPSSPAYPKAIRSDAPFDLTEATLRGAIYIPSTFRYGASNAPQPVILVPGTGTTGYQSFAGNLIPLLQGSEIGDPVWLNIPGQLLNDAQTNAEYVAYAINYIYGISGHRKVAVVTWSQGGIDAQWAYKYWPSTRSRVTDQVAFSPDYHGTVLANFIDIPQEPLPPSILQQEYTSNFITTLRNNGGDSAYVPTTSIYSGFFGEIVEPQQNPNASAILKDARNVGVSNNQVQVVCSGKAAGGFFLHEGTLYNNLGFALLVDALSHDGPGQPSRLNLESVCAPAITTGLNFADFLETENAILIAGLSVLLYPHPVNNEPAIKGKLYPETLLESNGHY